ncbi:DUF397 domain-containing protein [Streptomyces violascens]|uniref:DUF397 domain-containing protein n=1 Tax=Streptomyces violascens TaxID=67381 RepID=UPI003647D2E1
MRELDPDGQLVRGISLPQLKWLKSAYSEASGNSCVEIAAIRTASRSATARTRSPS